MQDKDSLNVRVFSHYLFRLWIILNAPEELA